MAEKKAAQRLIRGDDGRVRVIFIDLKTLLPVLPLDLSNYDIINAGNTYFEPVKDINDPETPSEQTSGDQINPPERFGDSQGHEPSGEETGAAPSTGAPSRPSAPSTPSRPGRGITQAPSLDEDTSVGRGIVDESRDVTEDAADAVGSGPGPQSGTGFTGGPGMGPGGPSGTSGPTGTNEGGSKANIDYSGLEGKGRGVAPDQGFMDALAEAVGSYFGPGHTVSVQSGQQSGKSLGAFGQIGSGRHNTGKAVDFDVVGPDGKVMGPEAMAGLAMALGNAGFTGLGQGPGYMGDGSRMHVDQANPGAPAAWGAGGTKSGMTDQAYSNAMGSMGFSTEGKTVTGRRAPAQATPYHNPPTPTPAPRGPEVSPTPGVTESPSLDPSTGVGKGVLDAFTGVTGAGKGRTSVTDSFGNEYSIGGSRASRNNNPGNIEAGKFADAHGAVGSDGRFAVFGTPQAGRQALESLLGTQSYQGGSVADAIGRYAPANENNTSSYTNNVAKSLGVSPDTPMSSLSKDQISKMADAISGIEGSKPGPVTDSKGNQVGTYGPQGFTPGPGFQSMSDTYAENAINNSTPDPGELGGLGGAFGGVGSGPGRGTSAGGPGIGGQTGLGGFGAGSATGGFGGGPSAAGAPGTGAGYSGGVGFGFGGDTSGYGGPGEGVGGGPGMGAGVGYGGPGEGVGGGPGMGGGVGYGGPGEGVGGGPGMGGGSTGGGYSGMGGQDSPGEGHGGMGYGGSTSGQASADGTGAGVGTGPGGGSVGYGAGGVGTSAAAGYGQAAESMGAAGIGGVGDTSDTGSDFSGW